MPHAPASSIRPPGDRRTRKRSDAGDQPNPPLASGIDPPLAVRQPPEPATLRRGKQPTAAPTPPPPGTVRRSRNKPGGQTGSPLLPGDLPPRSGPRLSDLLFERFVEALNQRAAPPDGSTTRSPTED